MCFTSLKRSQDQYATFLYNVTCFIYVHLKLKLKTYKQTVQLIIFQTEQTDRQSKKYNSFNLYYFIFCYFLVNLLLKKNY